jgi:hypothetical protein
MNPKYKTLLTKYKTILGCILFNLLLEYWVHGIENFVIAWYTAPALFLLYLAFFSMLEDVIVRFNLRDYQVFLCGFIFGYTLDLFYLGDVFKDEIFLGINPIIIVLIHMSWWGFLQSVIGMYFSNRVLGNRDWDHPKMGVIGWILSIGYLAFILVSEQIEQIGNTGQPTFPYGSLTGYITSIVIISLTVVLFWKTLRQRESLKFNKSRTLDFLTGSTLILCVAIGTFLGYGNYEIEGFQLFEFRSILLILWTIFVAIVFSIYRVKTRKSISI